MKSIILTGANGFVGRHTLLPLLEKGYQVHALYYASLPVVQHPNIVWHKVNLHDVQEIESLLMEVSASHLLHLAWYAAPGKYWTSPLNAQWLASSLSLLEIFASAGGKRVVLAGSCAEYDWSLGICKEFDTLCLPAAAYGQAKYQLFLKSQSFAEQHGLSLAWARLFFLFGPYEYPERLVPSLILRLLNHENFEINHGHQYRDFMHVQDVANALVALLDSEMVGPVNIASGQGISIRQLALCVANQLQAHQYLKFKTADVGKEDKVLADVHRLKDELHWRPVYTFDQAVRHTLQWWKDQQ